MKKASFFIALLAVLRLTDLAAQAKFQIDFGLTGTPVKLGQELQDYMEPKTKKLGWGGTATMNYSTSSTFSFYFGLGFAHHTSQIGSNGRWYEAGNSTPVPFDKQAPFVYSTNAITVSGGVELTVMRTSNGEITASAGLKINNNLSGEVQNAKPTRLGTDPDGIATVTYEKLQRPEKIAFGSAQLDDFTKRNTDLCIGLHYNRWNNERSGALRLGIDYAMGISNTVNTNNPDSKIFFGNPVKNRTIALRIGYMWVL